MHLCLKCFTKDQLGPLCTLCGGRVVFHSELSSLTIAHVDADAFYASVEKRDRPELLHVPVIVGGNSRRSVVTTACYIARQSGVRSAQPMHMAMKLCPEAIVIQPRMDRYKEVSDSIRSMMEELTPLVQTVSLDEAYLDLSGTEKLHNACAAEVLARLAKRVDQEIGITISIGLSHAPYLAKIASDLEKPYGFSVIGREETVDFLSDRPISIFSGVGKKTEDQLRNIGVELVRDLKRIDPALLRKTVGDYSYTLMDYAFGRDGRRIAPNGASKSISAERTFQKDVERMDHLTQALWPLAEKVSFKAKDSKILGNTITLKLKTSKHVSSSRQMHLANPTQLAEDIYDAARSLLEQSANKSAYRLIGISLSGFTDEGSGETQGFLFDDGSSRREAAERALDLIRDRWGKGVAFKGRSLR